MSDENDEIDRIANTVDNLLEKLGKYNDSLLLSQQQLRNPNIQIEFRDSILTTSAHSQHQSPPLPPQPESEFTTTFTNKLLTTIKRKLGISKSSKSSPESLNTLQIKQYRRHLHRRYLHHFGSFEAFFIAYIKKLEEKYTKSLPRSSTRPLPIPALIGKPPAKVREYFDTYSLNVLKVDAFYWSAGGLMNHWCVRKGGKGFTEGIERMQSRAVNFLMQYDRVMLLSPRGIVRVALLPLEVRERLQRKRKRKKG
ncbi:9521_t:CDS:1 [Ambispora gerdemannii]|uniref:9521_t:CDS:1 n=1 Tax=Ambispora gerdemannii TaxID=144530 RepID=A0A9N9FDG4_9GLOM|nr:9521_t:CDS:1 [Ambispora gerdemannii]